MDEAKKDRCIFSVDWSIYPSVCMLVRYASSRIAQMTHRVPFKAILTRNVRHREETEITPHMRFDSPIQQLLLFQQQQHRERQRR